MSELPAHEYQDGITVEFYTRILSLYIELSEKNHPMVPLGRDAIMILDRLESLLESLDQYAMKLENENVFIALMKSDDENQTWRRRLEKYMKSDHRYILEHLHDPEEEYKPRNTETTDATTIPDATEVVEEEKLPDPLPKKLTQRKPLKDASIPK